MNPKIPPQDIEGERSVIGAIMLDKNAITKIGDVLDATDFYTPAHAKIFSAVLDLFEKNEPIDVLSVTNRLKAKGQLEAIGGSAYLAEIMESVPSSSHVAYYAKEVKQKRILRDMLGAASGITERAFSPVEDIEDFVDEVEQKIFSITQKSRPQNFVLIKDELVTAYERIERLSQGDRGMRGVPTGFTGIDNKLSGMQKSDLIIVGARPSLGKTSFCLDIARHVAVNHKVPVGVFSLEMSRDQIVDRFISAESSVPLWKLRTGRITDDVEFDMIRGALDRLNAAPIYIDDTPSMNILQMRSVARRVQAEHNLGLMIIDYLQLIQPRTNSDNMAQSMAEVSRGLKSIARELSIPILAAAQLSRAVEQRDDKNPRLADLRESGSIEQDADIVMFLSRKNKDRLDLSPEDENIVDIIIAKHRNGPLGTVPLHFDQERASFKNIDLNR